MIQSLKSLCKTMFLFSQILVEINEKREKKIKEDNKNINTLKNNKFNIKIINKENGSIIIWDGL